MTLIQAAIATQNSLKNDAARDEAIKRRYLQTNRRMTIYLIERNIEQIKFSYRGRNFVFRVMPSYDTGKITSKNIYAEEDAYYRTSTKIVEDKVNGDYPRESSNYKLGLHTDFYLFAMELMSLFLEEKSDQYSIRTTPFYGGQALIYSFDGNLWTPEKCGKSPHLKKIREEDLSHPDPINAVNAEHINWVEGECIALLDSLSYDEKCRVVAQLMNSMTPKR
jgi:hypothetical protein